MQELVLSNKRSRVAKVKRLLLSAGNQIGSVHFHKRDSGDLRRMCYRLHTRNPSYASKPAGKKVLKDSDYNQITVLDVNKVRYNRRGGMNGRGDWRTIPLENVIRICVNGEKYRIRS